MDVNTAKKYIFETIVQDAFTQKELLELNEITQGRNQWAMDFKRLSLHKEFLEAFVAIFDETFKDIESIQVCGMESGALPFLTAIQLYSPKCKNAFYIRKSAKKSDLARTVEGDVRTDVPTIIVDDLINNGNTTHKVIRVLEECGVTPYASFTILRFRNVDDYVPLFGEKFKIESIYEVNDFAKVLPVENISRSSLVMTAYDAWVGEWKISPSKYNPYIVVPKSGPVSYKDCVYMGADDGYMRAIRKKDGHVIWQTPVLFGEGGKRIFSTPAVSEKGVFFGSYDGNFYCLDRHTGKKKWVFMEAEWIGSSPSVSSDGKTVYVGLEFGLFRKHGGVVALDTDTGEPRWKYYDMKGLTHASPAASDKLGVVVCGCNDHYVYCFDIKRGTLLWKYETHGEVKYSAVFDEKRGLVIIGSMDGNVYCLDVKTGLPYATFTALAGFYSTPALLGDRIFIGSQDKRVYCFDLNTKTLTWTVLTRGRIFSSPCIYQEHVFIGSNDGGVYEIDSQSGKIISITQLSNRVTNRIVVEEENESRTMYVATDTCDLYKFKGKN